MPATTPASNKEAHRVSRTRSLGRRMEKMELDEFEVIDEKERREPGWLDSEDGALLDMEFRRVMAKRTEVATLLTLDEERIIDTILGEDGSQEKHANVERDNSYRNSSKA
ncbi:hypothetical protein EV426DRAFT_709655 [Tirmania nivea]|nr:hypothetical protein EV426DRAFT_709655 [Tirmania nivea]